MSLRLLKSATIRTYPVVFYRFDPSVKPVKTMEGGPSYFVSGIVSSHLECILRQAGFMATKNAKDANLIVGTVPYAHPLAPDQRNLIPSLITVITSSGSFHRALTSYSFRFQRPLVFYPQTFLIPAQTAEFRSVAGSSAVWVEKDSSSNTPVRLFSEVPASFSAPEVIVQAYPNCPISMRGFLFDVRFFAGAPSFSPLRIYLHSAGIVRLATERFWPHFDDLDSLRSRFPGISAEGDCLVDPELWPALEALGFERERIVRDVEAAVIDAILAGEPQGRSSAALLEFVFALDANSKIQLAAIASPDLDARMGGEHEVIQAVVRDFLNLALVPKRTPFAERIEEAFAKEELRPLARFVEAVELEIGEARRGGFRRIFPANGMQREGESDEALAKYAEFSEEEQTKFYGDMVPVFDQYIEDLLDCKNQGAACAVA